MKKFFYRVQQGDTLTNICTNLSAPVFLVIKENNLTADVCPGDLIYVESFATSHLVLPFEDLLSLSRRLKVSTTEILQKNGNPPYFYCGMKVYL